MALNELTVFLFTLGIKEGVKCAPVSYRPGDCCNQAVDGISLGLDPVYASLVKYVKMYTYDGKDIRVQTQYDDASGLYISLPTVTYISDLPDNAFLTFEIGFDINDWADTTKMPCKKSAYEPSLPTCDYFLHGFQTEPGNPSLMLPPDDRTPGCCPEGVVSFCSERIKGTCNPRLSDSPYRLRYLNSTQLLRTTMVAFQVFTKPVSHPIGPKEGLPDCSNMMLGSWKLYLSDAAADKFVQMSYNGITVETSKGRDAAGWYIESDIPGSRSGTGNWVLTLDERFDDVDVCGYNVGQFSVCNFVFNSKFGTCCTMGDAIMSMIERTVIKYGH